MWNPKKHTTLCLHSLTQRYVIRVYKRIHSPCEEHLGCRVKAITNTAAMNILYIIFGTHMYIFLSGIYLGVELLSHRGVCSAFIDIDSFPKWLYQCKPHQHVFLSTEYCGSFSFSPFLRVVVVSHCSFNLHSPNDQGG